MSSFFILSKATSMDDFRLLAPKTASLPHWRSLRFLPCIALLVTVTCFSFGGNNSCLAQTTSPYYWDDSLGGLVDTTTGLVWGFGPQTAGIWDAGSDYAYAMENAATAYADSAWGYGYDDWFVPTKALMVDGAGKGLYAGLDAKAYEFFSQGGPPSWHIYQWYMAADAEVKVRGVYRFFIANIASGGTTYSGSVNGESVLCARWAFGAPPPPPPPPGHGKGK